MKKIFIAYSDVTCAYSLKRIGKQAKKIGYFDEVILYTPEQLPDYIKKSPLMKYKYGGGYWVWKPAIIWETLQGHKEGDIVVYVDSGCTIKRNSEWNMFFCLMERYDTICFQYKDLIPEWKKFGNESTKIKYWTKKTLLQYLDTYFGDNKYRDFNKIMGGCLFMKGRNNPFLKKWLDFTLEHPELIMDPTKEEMKDQYKGFAQHKHDQSLITGLAYYDKGVIILPEISETCGEDVFCFASRIRAKDFKEYFVLRLKYWLRRIFGNNFIELIKRL